MSLIALTVAMLLDFPLLVEPIIVVSVENQPPPLDCHFDTGSFGSPPFFTES